MLNYYNTKFPVYTDHARDVMCINIHPCNRGKIDSDDNDLFSIIIISNQKVCTLLAKHV